MRPVYELITASILGTGLSPNLQYNCYYPPIFFDTADYYDPSETYLDHYPCNL